MANKSNGFAALSQSLAHLGEDVRSGDAPVSKPKKRSHKKKGSKPKETVEVNGYQKTPASEVHTEDSDEWIKVIPKKSKIKENGLVNSIAPSLAPESSTPNQQIISDSQSSHHPSHSSKQKKRKNNDDKPERQLEQSESKTDVNTKLKEEEVESPKPIPALKNRPNQKPKTAIDTTPTPSAPTPLTPKSQPQKSKKREGEASPSSLVEAAFTYTRQLEYIVAESLGPECVAKARSVHTNLNFSLPLPSVSATDNLTLQSDTLSKTEIAFLKADLQAKNIEVKVLKEKLKFLLSQSDLPQAPPFITILEKKSEPEKTVKKPKSVSKQVQCDVSGVQQQSQFPSATSSSPSQLTIAKSLQAEIANLNKEIAILSQRYDNVSNRLETRNQEYSKLQSEAKKMSTKAAKEAEVRVRQETEALVKKLQDGISEKDAHIAAKSAQIESLQQELTESQSRVSQLLQSEQASEARESEYKNMLSQLKSQNEGLKKEKEDLVRDVETAKSEMTWLKRRLTESELEASKAQGECLYLKEELEKSHSELVASKQAVADMSTNESLLKALEAEKINALAEVECLKKKLSANESQLIDSQSEVSTLKELISTKQSELENAKVKLADKESELESAHAELQKLMEQQELKNKNGVSEAPDPNCPGCFEWEEMADHYRSTLIRAERNLSNIQTSMACDQASVVENGQVECE